MLSIFTSVLTITNQRRTETLNFLHSYVQKPVIPPNTIKLSNFTAFKPLSCQWRKLKNTDVLLKTIMYI